MAYSNFFNENINRTFPFQVGTAGILEAAEAMRNLPDAVIADCGFIMGPESYFQEGQTADGLNQVFLHQFIRTAEDPDEIQIEFRVKTLITINDETSIQTHSIVFTRHIDDPNYTLEFAESAAAECSEPIWSGYLVTGLTSALFNALPLTGMDSGDLELVRLDLGSVLVEPALIQNLSENQVISVSLANADRTRAARVSKCDPYEWAGYTTGEIYINRECLQADLRLRPGYNIAISQSRLNNVIQFSAITKAGLGEPCAEVKLFEAETPPTGATNNLLAGDFYCNEVLRTINGLQGPTLTLFAGTGVAILADNPASTIVVDINLSELSLCTYSTVSTA